MAARLWLLVPLTVALLTAAQIWVSHLRNEVSLSAQRLAAEQKVVEKELSKLRLELASLTRPERLRRYARRKLGMAPPSPSQVVHL